MTEIIAQFTNSPARIADTTPVYCSSLQAAYDTAPDGATIQARDMTLTENLNANLPKTVTLIGGYNADYTGGTGVTTNERFDNNESRDNDHWEL